VSHVETLHNRPRNQGSFLVIRIDRIPYRLVATDSNVCTESLRRGPPGTRTASLMAGVDYSRAVMIAYGAEPADVKIRIARRFGHQAVALTKATAALTIVTELAPRLPVGGAEVPALQVRHLAEAGSDSLTISASDPDERPCPYRH
jgi:hypothetical protein